MLGANKQGNVLEYSKGVGKGVGQGGLPREVLLVMKEAALCIYVRVCGRGGGERFRSIKRKCKDPEAGESLGLGTRACGKQCGGPLKN